MEFVSPQGTKIYIFENMALSILKIPKIRISMKSFKEKMEMNMFSKSFCIYTFPYNDLRNSWVPFHLNYHLHSGTHLWRV